MGTHSPQRVHRWLVTHLPGSSPSGVGGDHMTTVWKLVAIMASAADVGAGAAS